MSDEFEIQPDRTKDCGVSCPCASGKIPYSYSWRNLVNTLAPSFLIRSSSFLQVTRTYMKVWMSFNFSQIPHSSAFIFHWVFFILAGNEDIHESLDDFKFRQICNGVTALD